MPEFPDDLQIRFEEAIELFQKRISVSDNVLEELEERHRQQAFFITGVSKAEMLGDIKAELETALEDGQSLDEFRDRLEDIAEKHGWKPGENAWRQRLIYRQNLTNAYHAGRREQVRQIQEDAEETGIDVFVLYRHGRPIEPREHHIQWEGTVLPAGHEAWATYWPPNGFNCTCKAFSLDRAAIERRGLAINEDFPETNPPLPDPGFRSAPGTPAARRQRREELLSALDDQRRRQVLDEMRSKGIDLGG
jgi:uncharacterized protein with gpF-like domain